MEDDLETLVGDNDMDLSLSSQDALSDADIPDDISESSSATNTNTNVVQGASEKRPRSFLSKVNPFHTDPDPEEVTEVHTRVLEKTPNGYPRLAAFQSSEANFALYRNFSYLHSRVLLDMQDELTTLEKELDDADREDSYDGRRQMRLHSRTEDVDSYNEYKAKLRRKDERREKREKREAERREMQRQVAENGAPAATTVETDDDDDDDADDATSTASSEPEDYLTRPRREILAEIKCKLYEYDKWMIKSRKMTGFQRPSERNYRSVRRYINNAKPLMDADNDSIRHKEDILSLRNGREWAGFDGFVERSLQIIDQKVLKPILRTEKPPLQVR
ncbi:hypothetical protein EJ05DRAFT_96314 [Pseudovirgaria hyperparasitica]|uniref:DUF6594 domain-containing protein n=1 Tax=Pseudovirgaria hyperparasitica TaxID=470096 RepID=A0A6A6W2Q3_9PEZI|nr:uncharacterized protein EJ05DRAFT_96314 [Pseudovirgaria hyperparasitica]KAF2756294.1 hypothetical protein EJ05DRAFT_96314 [Pseudovirgaria hyperparasitica]